SGLASAQFLPTPWAVVERFAELTHTPFVGFTIQEHLLSSVKRYLAGFGLAAVIGVPLGLAMGWYRVLDAIVSPLFEAIRFVAPSGIGYLIVKGQSNISTSTVMAGMIGIGVVGFAIDAMLRRAEAAIHRRRGR